MVSRRLGNKPTVHSAKLCFSKITPLQDRELVNYHNKRVQVRINTNVMQRTGDCAMVNAVFRSLMPTITFSVLVVAEVASKRSCFWYSGSSCGGLAMSRCDIVGGELM